MSNVRYLEFVIREMVALEDCLKTMLSLLPLAQPDELQRFAKNILEASNKLRDFSVTMYNITGYHTDLY
jgi:hypothetical protein